MSSLRIKTKGTGERKSMSHSLMNLPAPSPVRRKTSKPKATKDTNDTNTNSYIQQRVAGYFSTKRSFVKGTVTSYQNNIFRIEYDDGNGDEVLFNDPNAEDGRDLVRMIENYARFDKETVEMDPQELKDNHNYQVDFLPDDCSENQNEMRMQFLDSILDSTDRVLDSDALSKISTWVHTDTSELSTTQIDSSETTSGNSSVGFFESISQLCTLLEDTVKVGIRLDLIQESRKEFDLENLKVR